MHDIIKYLYPGIQDWQFSLQDDGNGVYIASWNYPEGPPTQAEMDAAAPEVAFQGLVRDFTAAIEVHLHAEAVAHGYDNIVRACMYAAAVNPYQSESQSFVAWAGEVWFYTLSELDKVKLGTRTPTPSAEDIVSELPARIEP